MFAATASGALLVGLSGCGTLPNVGPSANDVADQSVVDYGGALAQRYEIVDIDAAAVDAARLRPPDSFRASFGDYRGSLEPRIGVGDRISVTIWEAGAGGLFSGPIVADRFTTGSKSATIPDQAIGRDGLLTVPYAGAINVLGKTQRAVQTQIEAALEGKAIQPQVLVNVTNSLSSAVTVTGEVVAGARIPLSAKGDRLLDIIATAGGVRAPVNETFVRLSRGGRTASVALSRVVADPRENIFMRAGDDVVLVRDPQTIIAYGATGVNAQVPFDAEGITLAQALAKAGGLLDQRSDPSGVFIFRYETERVARALRPGSPLIAHGALTPIVYRLNLRDPNSLFIAQHFPMYGKDLIYVSNAPITEAQKALSIFITAASPVATGVQIGAAIK